MTRFIHDKFAKDYLRDLLSYAGKVETSYTVASEVREIDVLFKPTQQLAGNLKSLGLLGDIAKTPCIVEPFRNPPTLSEIRACISKLLDVYAYLEREAKKNQKKVHEEDLPYLWILAPTTSDKILDKLRVASNETKQIQGVYTSVEAIKTGIIVIHRLEATTETLWLRILGKGEVQRQAISELNALPKNDLSRQKATLWLSNLQADLQNRKNLGQENRELIMSISPILQERLQQAKQEGRQEGRQEGVSSLVIRQLSKRFGILTPELQQTISELPLNKLDILSEALLDFSSIEDLQAWLSSNT